MQYLNYNCKSETYENWMVEETIFDVRYLRKYETIFCQGNGYLGLRNALEERYVEEQRNMFVTGTFNQANKNQSQELPNLPDITNTDIYVNNHRFYLEEGKFSNYHRTMNYKTGETIREVTWACPTGERVCFRFRRFISLDREHVIGNNIEIWSLDGDVEIQIESGIDGKMTNTGVQHFTNVESRIYDGEYIQMVSTTNQSKISAVVQVVNKLWVDQELYEENRMPYIRNRRNVNIYTVSLKKGSHLCLEKLSTVHTTRDKKYSGMNEEHLKEQVMQDAMEELKEIQACGYDVLFKESAKKWEAFWETRDVQIESKNNFDQIAIRFAIYHLNIMNKEDDNRVGVGAKGLSGEEYKGHSFWDTEIFLMPYYILTNPKAARTLLEYRYYILKGAHHKAEKAGYRGAMYPWESAWIDDGEVCADIIGVDIVTGKPMRVLTGEIEIHISADIAYAVWEYYIYTQDEEFMELYGYEIILDTARFWTSRVEWNEQEGRYDINNVIGPDEYKENVDNNAYTNYMAHYNLKLALRILDILPERIQKRLDTKMDLNTLRMEVLKVVERLYLPVPREEDGIIAQNATYLCLKEIDISKYKNCDVVGTIHRDYNMEQLKEIQVSKQGDLVVLLYLLGDLFNENIKKKNYLYYENHTLHDSSLSKCLHAILANDFGMEEDAYQFFKESALDIGPNMKSCDNGVHSASCGGIWQTVIMGFGGVRIVDGELSIQPRLPKEWKSLSFNVQWRGERLHVYATKEVVEIKK